jgi:SAM-dependent methyltransferase
VNQAHIDFLSSAEWARLLETDLLPWVDAVGDLGDDVLEIGPGPGRTTDLLRARTPRLTAVEVDPVLAEALACRLDGSNVDVVCGDGTASGFEADRFTAATCFSVLHHLPTPDDQDGLFAEVARVLRPGSMFVGADSLDVDVIRAGHEDDVFTPVDPKTLPRRLARFGFRDARIEVGSYQFKFVATKPHRSSP